MNTDDEPQGVLQPAESVQGEDAQRVLRAINDQARDVLVFPQFAVNLAVEEGQVTFVLEFHRIPGAALDATVIVLSFEQMTAIGQFLEDQVGAKTHAEYLRTVVGPTKERTEDDPEA